MNALIETLAARPQAKPAPAEQTEPGDKRSLDTERIAYAGYLTGVGVIAVPAIVGLFLWALGAALSLLRVNIEPIQTIASAGSGVAIVGAVALAPAAIVGRRWAPIVTSDGRLLIRRAIAMSAAAVLLGDVLTAGALAFVLLIGGGDLAAPIWFAYMVLVGGGLFGGPAFVLGLPAIYLWSRLLPRAIRWSTRA